MSARYHVDQHRLTGGITAHDGYVLTFFEGEVYWLGHGPFRLFGLCVL
jgi:hypothetical protein